VTEEEQLAAEFETHRPYLHAIAFRTLGSHADADDAVQEAWLRLARTGRQGIEDLRGWLTTVTGRICLDALRRRGVRGEQPLELSIGMLPPEAAGDAGIDPEEEVLLADSVGLALYVVMDALTPAERVSFVLHDVFEIPFDAIGAILGRSTAATKMLASRAPARWPTRCSSTATLASSSRWTGVRSRSWRSRSRTARSRRSACWATRTGWPRPSPPGSRDTAGASGRPWSSAAEALRLPFHFAVK
jgi:RNA polymerase sigma-70 factor (ECF subfamily)